MFIISHMLKFKYQASCLKVNNLVGTHFHYRNSHIPEFLFGTTKRASWGWQCHCHNSRRKKVTRTSHIHKNSTKTAKYLLFHTQLHLTDTSLYCFLVRGQKGKQY